MDDMNRSGNKEEVETCFLALQRKKLTIIANGLAEGMQQGEANARRHGNSEENEKKAKRFSAQKAHVVDYYSRIGVPIIYFIFLSAYTVYYVSNSS